MGYLLKEALKIICGFNQWSYAVFWKIGCQNPKLLIWEDCYYEPNKCSALRRISGIESPELAFEEWKACLVSAEAQPSQLEVQTEDEVCLLVNKMMMSNQVNIVGEGLVGRAAFTGKHQWIRLENYAKEAHPPEVLNELCQQFSAGMQTVAVIPVFRQGVVQLGSSLVIMENTGFVNDVKTLILRLGCVAGAFLSDNCTTKEPSPRIGVPLCLGKSVYADLGNYKLTTSTPPISDGCNLSSSQATGLTGQPSHSLFRDVHNNLKNDASTFRTPNLVQSLDKSHDDFCQSKVLPVIKPNIPLRSQLESSGVTGAEVITPNPEVWLNQQVSLNIPRSEFDQQPCVGASSANYSSFTQEQILSDSSIRAHANNSLNASCSFMMSQLRTNGDLISSSHKDSANRLLLEGSQLQNEAVSCLRSIPNPCSLPSAHRSANSSMSGTHLIGSGLQNAGSAKTKVSISDLADHLTINPFSSRSSDHRHYPTDDKSTQIEWVQKQEKIENDLLQALGIPLLHPDEHTSWRDQMPGFVHDSQMHDYGNHGPSSKNAKYEDACFQAPAGDDLFDILGVDFKNKLFNENWNNFSNNQPDSNTHDLGRKYPASKNLHYKGSDLYSVNGGNSDTGILHATGNDHLLDAVVFNVHSAAKQSSDDNVSCRTTLTKISSSYIPNASPSCSWVSASEKTQGELFGPPKTLAKAGAVGSCSFRSDCSKEDTGNYSQTSSIYGSQISSWVEQGHTMKHNSTVSTAYSKRPDEGSKSNRKRLKPGENPRPRPKDRQMIQDRVKELREIVPNGAKCSIDALLERTVKHMLFLQSVTKHADKIKQTEDSKIISKEGGLLLKDNFEGGATWAYEVGSQSMVCPIIVEDLNPPRQMLVEMVCEERGLFLEIADIIRGLGLTILKGVMETRNDKIWARFAVEANRDVTRMEIFLSLVRVLEQSVKSSAAAVNGIDNDNMMVHQSFHEATSIPATGRA